MEIFNTVDDLEIFKKLVQKRKESGLTQEKVAERMKTTASAVARFESGGGKKRHSPSLKTFSSYVNAIGFSYELNLVKKQSGD